MSAAKELGCSPFELLARDDLAYWLDAATVTGQFEAWREKRAAQKS